MGVDVNDIKQFVFRIVQATLQISHRFVQRHPYVSGALLFLINLYIFLPAIISFLLYTFPFLVCTAFLLGIFWTSERSRIHESKQKHEKLGFSRNDVLGNRNERNPTSRRRYLREKSEGWHNQAGWREQDIDSWAASAEKSNNGSNKPIEDSPEEIIEEKQSCSIDPEEDFSAKAPISENIKISEKQDPVLSHRLSMSDLLTYDGRSNSQNHKYNGGGESKTQSSEDSEDENEEETQEDGDKAVEWTEDDEKNLMDLGLSEIERNRRLESLIAKRRERKLARGKVDKDRLIVKNINHSGQICKVNTAKSGLLDSPNSSNSSQGIEGLHMPGSAPSVLLPLRNPFDLPYDPLEEKPDLTADSFQQEFTPANQKEFPFSRHESFRFGPSHTLDFNQSRQDAKLGTFLGTEKWGFEGTGYPRYRRPSEKGDHDWLIEQLLFKGAYNGKSKTHHAGERVGESDTQAVDLLESKHDEDREITKTMVNVEGMEMENAKSTKISSDAQSVFHKEPNLIRDSNGESGTGSGSSSSSENSEQIFNSNKDEVSQSVESMFHTIVQQPLTCSTPKGRMMKESIYDSSPIANEKDRMDDFLSYGHKGPCHTPAYSIASDLQVEVSEVGSPPSTVDGTNSPTEGESLTDEGDIEKETSSGVEEMWATSSELCRTRENDASLRDVHFSEEEFSGNDKSSEDVASSKQLGHEHKQDFVSSFPDEKDDTIPLPNYESEEIQVPLQNFNQEGNSTEPGFIDALPPESMQNTTALTEELVAHPHDFLSEIQEELPNPSEELQQEATATMNTEDAAVHTTRKTEIEKMREDIGGRAEMLAEQEDEGEQSKPVVRPNLESDNSITSVIDPVQSLDGNENLNQIEEDEGVEKPSVHDGNTDITKPIEAENQWESTQDRKDEQNIVESGDFLLEQSIVLAEQQELDREEVSLSSTSPSSPKSILHKQISTDPISSYDFSQNIYVDVQQSDIGNMMKGSSSSSSNEQAPPQTAPHLADDSAAPTKTTNSETLQEISKNPEKSTEERRNVCRFYESVFEYNVYKENSECSNFYESDSESLFSIEAAGELSKSAEEAYINFTGYTENIPVKLTESEESNCATKLENENIKPDIPKIDKAEEKYLSSRKLPEASVDNASKSPDSNKEDKELNSVEASEDDRAGGNLSKLSDNKSNGATEDLAAEPEKWMDEAMEIDISIPSEAVEREVMP